PADAGTALYGQADRRTGQGQGHGEDPARGVRCWAWVGRHLMRRPRHRLIRNRPKSRRPCAGRGLDNLAPWRCRGIDEDSTAGPLPAQGRREGGMKGGWTYIMTNAAHGTLYIGVTSDLPARITRHREGRGSEF